MPNPLKSLNPRSPVLNVKNIIHNLSFYPRVKRKNFPSHCTLWLFVTCWRLLHKFASLTVKAGERDSRAKRADLLNLVLQLRILDSGGSVRSRRFCLVSLLSGFPVSCNVDDPTSSWLYPRHAREADREPWPRNARGKKKKKKKRGNNDVEPLRGI